MKLRATVIGCFRTLARHAIRHPTLVLGLALLVTLAAVPGITRLKLRTDGNALIPQQAPEVLFDRSIRERFGIEDNIVVLISSRRAEGIFNSATLQLVRDLTVKFARLPGLGSNSLTSLATETSFRFRPGTFALQTLLEPPLKTKTELDQLRQDLQKIELYNGTLLSADGQSTAILIGVPAGVECLPLYRKVLDIIASTPAALDEVAVSGAPVAESLLGNHLLEDLGVPKILLGTSTRSREALAGWKVPGQFLRTAFARRATDRPRSAGHFGNDDDSAGVLPQFARRAGAVAGNSGDAAVCVWLDGLVRRAGLSHHRRHAGAAHRHRRCQ